MTEIEKNEIQMANDLFTQAHEMINRHLQKGGPWDHVLFNRMVIQLQVAWPAAYSAITSGDKP